MQVTHSFEIVVLNFFILGMVDIQNTSNCGCAPVIL